MLKLSFVITIIILFTHINALFYGEMGGGLGYTRSQGYEEIHYYGDGNYVHKRNTIWQESEATMLGGKMGFQIEDNSPLFLTLSSYTVIPLGLFFGSSIIYYPSPNFQVSTSYGYMLQDTQYSGNAMELSIAYDYGKDRGSLTGIKAFTTFSEYQVYSFMLFYSFRYSRSSSVGGSGSKFSTRQRF